MVHFFWDTLYINIITFPNNLINFKASPGVSRFAIKGLLSKHERRVVIQGV